jgi:PII-like signaling protein
VTALKLTIYFGERDRAGGRSAAEALGELFARRGVLLAVLLRGIEGFGLKHRLQTHRILSLSEDLPLVWVAVDRPQLIESLAAEVDDLVPEGLVTLERARILSEGGTPDAGALDHPGGEDAKLTLYLGRGERHRGRLAYLALVDALREAGVEGASVLLGVDGVRDGERRRARLLGPNSAVPVMVIAVGSRARIARALAATREIAPGRVATLETARILKRDGVPRRPLRRPDPEDGAGLGVWQKIMVFTAEDSRTEHGPLYVELVRRLREAGVAGATALGGVWGYSGSGPPHGDRMLRLRRGVPVVVVSVDRPGRISAAWPMIDRLTARSGVVTGELVPAFRAHAPGARIGGLRLARILDEAEGAE